METVKPRLRGDIDCCKRVSQSAVYITRKDVHEVPEKELCGVKDTNGRGVSGKEKCWASNREEVELTMVLGVGTAGAMMRTVMAKTKERAYLAELTSRGWIG